MNPQQAIEQLIGQIGKLFGQNHLTADLKHNLGALLQAALARTDVVTREEFDAQAAILARTREKLDALEVQLAELTKQLESPH